MRDKIRARESDRTREREREKERERETEREIDTQSSSLLPPYFTNWYIMDLCTIIMQPARAALWVQCGPRGPHYDST
jgi:hypothetical protein